MRCLLCSPATGKEALYWARQILANHGIDSPLLEAEVLLSHIWQKSRSQLLTALDDPFPDHLRSALHQLVEKRSGRYPLQYITGHQEFMSLEFLVNPNVLIPRTETEVLVEEVLTRLIGRDKVSLADVGTGSGVVAVSLAKYLPLARIYATEQSSSALAVAQENGCKLGVAEQIEWFLGDLLHPLRPAVEAGLRLDGVVSNPPYISEGEIAGLQPEVLYEPHHALSGGKDGLDIYRRLVPQAAILLAPGGFLALEIGCDQADSVAGIIRDQGVFEEIVVRRDYSGRPRVVYARLPVKERWE
ncbi:MAG: peptide chain release factor N(5)-glutamine methyltransferase [Bacillota bacterium]